MERERQANRLLARIALALLIFTLAAFTAKALIHSEVQARYTPLVVFHAATMIAWLALLASQAWLASITRTALHKAFGRASIALVAGMLVSGVIISINIGTELGRPEVTIVNLAAFVTFVPLYFAGVHFARARKHHAHRQAMLIGTLALMTPAYARVVQVLALPDPIAIAAQVPITIGIAVAYDWAVARRVTFPAMVMLGFSIALIAAMVMILALWFL